MQEDPIQKMAALCDKNFKALGDYIHESNKTAFAHVFGLLGVLVEKGIVTTEEWKTCCGAVEKVAAEFEESKKQKDLEALFQKLIRPSNQ